ncbi:hypothetical protein D3C76_1304510 [compost metagenome]
MTVATRALVARPDTSSRSRKIAKGINGDTARDWARMNSPPPTSAISSSALFNPPKLPRPEVMAKA